MIENGSYADFSRIVHNEVNPLRVPVNGTIEITNRCPLNCAHCYNNLPMNDHGARSNELTTADHKRILDELAALGSLWICYSGGEIFARHDFLEIYQYAKEQGFLVTLFTNGTMITERIADFLVEYPPFAIEITLYGRTKATYEALTGIPGSYEKCLRGIELLRERGLPLKLKTVAVTINKHEVLAMRRFSQELGLDFKFDPMINPRIDCSASPLAVRLSPVDVVALDLEDPERVSEWRRLATNHAPPPHPEGEEIQLYDCGGGVNSFAIDPYGALTICVLSHVDKYDLKNGTVAEGWNSFLLKVRTRRATRMTKCTSCALKSLCGSCAANGELENGDAEAPVDYLCRTAHLRAEVFDVPVRPHGDCEYCGDRRGEILSLAEAVHERAPFVAEDLPSPAAISSCGTSTCGSCSLSALHART